jgi:TctA family transporter
MLVPAPNKMPPHDPENHSKVAPVPGDPPFTVNVVLSPSQIDVIPKILLGATDSDCTVTVVDAQMVVLQVPLYRTK